MAEEPAAGSKSGAPRPGREVPACRSAADRTPESRDSARFRRRLFPERRYRLPLKWVLLAVMAGLAVMMILVLRRLYA